MKNLILSCPNYILASILGIGTKDVVYGRYIFSLFIILLNMLIGVLLYLSMSLVLNSDTNIYELASVFLLIFILGIFAIDLQYPLYFRYGYTKAKTVMMIPFLIVAIGTFLLATIKEHLIKNINLLNGYLLISFCIALIFLVTILSISISIKCYRKREF